MRPVRTPGLSTCLAILLSLLPTAPLLGEGTQLGVLTGVVVDAESLPLPDVEVRVRGPQAARTVLTDEAGRFRFPSLEVANYVVVADLLGLQAQREVRVHIDRVTEVELQLGAEPTELPVSSDEVDVLAVAPLLDRFETRVGASVSRELLEDLPVERFYQSVALLLPGVNGGEDGNPNVSGALRGANLYLIDGVDTTDPATGLFGLNLSYEAVEEVRVTTAAPPTAVGRLSGAVINVVTRSGGNRYHGGARWVLSGDDLNSDYDNAGQRLQPEVDAANADRGDLDRTLAATLGGALRKDRMWFFGAFEQERASFLRPSLDAGLWDEDLEIRSSLLKITTKLAEGHSLLAQRTLDRGSFAAFSLFDSAAGEGRASRAPSALTETLAERIPGDLFALQELSQEGDLSKLEWQGAVGQNLSLSGALARQEQRLERQPRNRRGASGDAPHLATNSFVPDGFFDDGTPAFRAVEGIYNGILEQGFEERQRDQGNLAAALYLHSDRADHELRFGIDLQRTRSTVAFDIGGSRGIDRFTGRPVGGQLFIDEDLRDPCFFDLQCQGFNPSDGTFQPFSLLNFWLRPPRETTQETVALYAQDSLSIGRWLLSAGVRWESVRGEADDGQRLVEHDGLAPRLALTYDPLGDGRTLLKASWSRFFEPFLQSYLDDFLRPDLFSGYTEYEWGDQQGLDCTGENPADLSSACWLPLGQVPVFPLPFAPPNPDLKRAAVDELVVGFERQLSDHSALRLSWIERDWRDLWDDRLVLDAEGFVTATVDNLPEAQRRYRALELLLQRRFADRWQLLASYTWSETEGNLFRADGFSTFADFSPSTDVNLVNRFGLAPYSLDSLAKVYGSYRHPLGRNQLVVGTALRFSSGARYQEERAADGGLRFLTRRGALQTDDLLRWDLSLALDVPLAGQAEFRLKLEGFNLTDDQAQLAANTDVDRDDFGEAPSIAAIQPPRQLRLTLGLSF